jgi:hypothetical protein
MSWNKYCIVITNIKKPDLEKLIKRIGYGRLSSSKEIEFQKAFNKQDDGEISFGIMNGCFWILSPNQVYKFFSSEPSMLEKNLIQCFPQSQILALEENSTVDSFGYSYLRNGQRVRVLNGTDGEYEYEFGEPIPEETQCYEELLKELDDEERQEIIDNEGEEGFKQYLLFESRWRVPSTLFKNVYGKSFEDAYDENAMFKQFSL